MNSLLTWFLLVFICSIFFKWKLYSKKSVLPMIALYVIFCILLIVSNYQLDEKIDKYSLIIGICMVVRSYMQKKESTLVGL